MNRNQFKLASGYGTGGSSEKVPVGEPIRHIYIDGQQFRAIRCGDQFEVDVRPGWSVRSETLDGLRERAIEALAIRNKLYAIGQCPET